MKSTRNYKAVRPKTVASRDGVEADGLQLSDRIKAGKIGGLMVSSFRIARGHWLTEGTIVTWNEGRSSLRARYRPQRWVGGGWQ